MASEGLSVDLNEKFHDLDKRLDVGFAELRGALNAALSAKEGAHARIEDRITDLDRDVVGVKSSVAAVHGRMDGYPTAEELRAVAEIAKDNKARLDRMFGVGIGIGFGSSIGGGGLVIGIAKALGAL